MPPWPEWQVEYVGSSFLGKLLGLWCGFWITLPKRLLRILETNIKHSKSHNHTDARLPSFEVRVKFYRIAVCTLLMLGFWRIATLKPLWSTFNERGHRIILSLLFLLTVSWMMSVVWIYFSKLHNKG